ncbi:MAG: nuclear transport factor 2 family protein [Solirubrobacteraceae bacterium]|nr:nuclear transport factor 2 family protein [Solirubrobacteraceae bacterium]
MSDHEVELVRRGYEAFARGDLAAVEELLDPDVQWHGFDEEDPQGGCRSRDQAIEFIHNALTQGASVEVLEIRPVGENVLVILQADFKDDDGQPVPHAELVTVRNDKIASMIVYADIQQAITASSTDTRPPTRN